MPRRSSDVARQATDNIHCATCRSRFFSVLRCPPQDRSAYASSDSADTRIFFASHFGRGVGELLCLAFYRVLAGVIYRQFWCGFLLFELDGRSVFSRQTATVLRG